MDRVLDRIDGPHSLKALDSSSLERLAEELRREIIETVAATGGHLAPNLGVVELTLALHLVFESPKDRIVWDVGHQCYVHKLLTGRLDRFRTLRQYGGISGFPSPRERARPVCDRAQQHVDIRRSEWQRPGISEVKIMRLCA